ncbi:hypothetical protein OF83DRAFT_564266 [Amylostereum chailletii]|nr:hypothetical protein OF83DRAFT_564266 [Amylostereum chailletii]
MSANSYGAASTSVVVSESRRGLFPACAAVANSATDTGGSHGLLKVAESARGDDLTFLPFSLPPRLLLPIRPLPPVRLRPTTIMASKQGFGGLYSSVPLSHPLSLRFPQWSTLRSAGAAVLVLVVLVNLYAFTSVSTLWVTVYEVMPQFADAVRIPYNWTGTDASRRKWNISDATAEFYLPFDPAQHPVLDIVPKRRQARSTECLENVIADGLPCGVRDEDTTMDLVWTWVNSTDPVWRYTHTVIEHQLSGKPGVPKFDYNIPLEHLRNYDELRYSMRSILQHFRRHTRRLNILASDFIVPETFPERYPKEYRLGQVPQWVDKRVAPAQHRDGDVELAIHHHSAYFDPYVGTSFSSFAIESQLPHLKGVSEVFIYLNDDMYFLRDLHPADFYTSAYGFVIRVQSWLIVPPTRDPHPTRGEWQPLRESNVMLSERFGVSPRPYLGHLAKTFSIPILSEMVAMWPEAFRRTVSRQLREVYRNELGDVHTAFLFGHFIVERWREALLWSWVVGKMGADDDWFDVEDAWAALGGLDDEEMMDVPSLRDRQSLRANQVKDTFDKAGYARPGDTTYIFSSADGYPYTDYRKGRKDVWPTIRPSSGKMCSMSRTECFPPELTGASDVFAHVAFDEPSCGDCIIHELVRQSGALGLSAFLPPPDRNITPIIRGEAPTTLPLASKWEDADFSLEVVFSRAPGPVNVRQWITRVMDRYRFVVGNSRSEFLFLKTARTAQKTIDDIERKRPSLLCLNDDLPAAENTASVVDIVRKWQSGRFPNAAAWEGDVHMVNATKEEGEEAR